MFTHVCVCKHGLTEAGRTRVSQSREQASCLGAPQPGFWNSERHGDHGTGRREESGPGFPWGRGHTAQRATETLCGIRPWVHCCLLTLLLGNVVILIIEDDKLWVRPEGGRRK